jgi:hypothetical protein
MKLTRRELPAALVAPAAAMAQAPAPAPPAGGDDLKAAREQTRRTGETLAKFEVPMATEPAFQFKA